MESSNNFSPLCMSFGMACFAKPKALDSVKYIQAHRLLECDPSKSCFGSGCIVIFH